MTNDIFDVTLHSDFIEEFRALGASPAVRGASKDFCAVYDVPEAPDHAGEYDVWVRGYIVGVATGSRKITFGGPYNKNTNLILGPSDTTTVREHCLAVQLPAGSVRDALNLVDHPDLTGQEIYVRGDLVDAYFGIPGLKSPRGYWMDSGSSPE